MFGFDVDKIREDFPILNRKINGKALIYLDNAATSQKPKQVLDAMQKFYEKHNANIHRGVHTLSQESTQMYDDAHKNVGKFINAKHPIQEIIFVRNATEAMNLVAHSLDFNEGDEIISTVMEHHANIVPWQLLRKNKGVVLKFVDIKEDGILDLEDLKSKISKKTRLVTCTHASNVVGTINPIKEIGKIVHEKGALFFVDAAQSMPHVEVDVRKMGADFLAFSGHKMLGPTGSGVLYGKKELLDKMTPFLSGGDMIKEVKLEESTWNDLPWKFEAGTPNIASGIGLSAAVDYIKKIGMKNIRKHEIEITAYALKRFEELKDVEIYGPKDPKKRTGLIAFNMKGIHPHDIGGILDSEYGIAIRSGHHCAQPLTERLGQTSTARASFYIYNTKEEVDVLIDGLKKVQKIFR